MKLLIASDIHGDVAALDALFARYEAEKADKMLLLGDLLYHGPRNDLPAHYAPKAVLARLNEYRAHILAVRGNCDAEVDAMVLQFPIMADYAYLSIDGMTLFATHGHLFEREGLPLGDAHYVQGHTHVPVCKKGENGRYILNPGSVSLPKEGHAPTYMIFEQGKFMLKTLDGEPYTL